MSKKQLSKNKPRPYAPEFRRQMVELVRAGRTPEQLAKEFEPSAQAIRNWLAQAARRFGHHADFVDTSDIDAVRAAVKPGTTKLVYIETPGNPLWTITVTQPSLRPKAPATLASKTCSTSWTSRKWFPDPRLPS